MTCPTFCTTDFFEARRLESQSIIQSEKILMKRIIRISLGVFFLILGLAGLVLPVLQGLLFLAIGALLLSSDLKCFARFEEYIKGRHPKIRRAIDRLKKKFPILTA
jgi:uncharacterized protein